MNSNVCIFCNKGIYSYKTMQYRNALDRIDEVVVPTENKTEYNRLCNMGRDYLHDRISCSYGLSSMCKYQSDINRTNHISEDIVQRVVALSFVSPDKAKEAIELLRHINPSGADRLRRLCHLL